MTAMIIVWHIVSSVHSVDAAESVPTVDLCMNNEPSA